MNMTKRETEDASHRGAVHCAPHVCGWMMEKWQRKKNESIMNETFQQKIKLAGLALCHAADVLSHCKTNELTIIINENNKKKSRAAKKNAVVVAVAAAVKDHPQKE